MPVKGGMNNKKGKFGYHDRLDMFIYILSLYYKNKDKKQYAKEYLTCYKNDKSLSSLCDYLDLFDDIYDYCKYLFSSWCGNCSGISDGRSSDNVRDSGHAFWKKSDSF